MNMPLPLHYKAYNANNAALSKAAAGYSSLNSCVTTLSIDTGKCLDVDILTKVYHGCQRIEKQTDASKKADMQERHQCKANYQGSVPLHCLYTNVCTQIETSVFTITAKFHDTVEPRHTTTSLLQPLCFCPEK